MPRNLGWGVHSYTKPRFSGVPKPRSPERGPASGKPIVRDRSNFGAHPLRGLRPPRPPKNRPSASKAHGRKGTLAQKCLSAHPALASQSAVHKAWDHQGWVRLTTLMTLLQALLRDLPACPDGDQIPYWRCQIQVGANSVKSKERCVMGLLTQ